MADQTLADQLLEAIQPLWGDEANAIRSTWTLSGMGGNDPELLEWMAGEIETVLVVPYLLQADINLSFGVQRPVAEAVQNVPRALFSLRLDDDVVVPLIGQHEANEETLDQWWRSRRYAIKLALRLKRLRKTIASSYNLDPGPPPSNPISPPTKRPRRRGL